MRSQPLLGRCPHVSGPSVPALLRLQRVAIGLLFAARRTGVLTLVFATLLAFSRVYTGEHYVSDVAAGALIGGGIAGLLTWTQPHLEPVIAPLLRVARRFHLA
jgi:membrane-associated phospholipid phosphatase